MAATFSTPEAVAKGKKEMQKLYPKSVVTTYRTIVISVSGQNAQEISDKITEQLAVLRHRRLDQAGPPLVPVGRLLERVRSAKDRLVLEARPASARPTGRPSAKPRGTLATGSPARPRGS